ncbi:hypothetical protein [Ferrimonas marina]|uniref:Uncharacterized protein n=1 Tax=Ferrimonas marina TaxID=299255 RepID=A0A1M5TY88_9GAMM|nr:hypothetical protein [Ferrimonas marina]SHH55570.1 hypothetical protein SAMN02745129_2323 [Ferrimonas marina]
MGILSRTGTADAAPHYSDNHIGEPAWSGASSDAFDKTMADQLERFIHSEAHRQGHNDQRNDRQPAPNLFHPDFLGGWPHRLWHDRYSLGFSTSRSNGR